MKRSRGKFGILIWLGDEVVGEKTRRVGNALTEIGLRVEAEAKKELYKGHGVITGTLRRSIHTATPGYTWASDNVIPAAGTPERGLQPALPGFDRLGAVIQVGSGMEYAIWVHQGHRSFAGYHFLTNAVEKVRPRVPEIVKRHAGGR